MDETELLICLIETEVNKTSLNFIEEIENMEE